MGEADVWADDRSAGNGRREVWQITLTFDRPGGRRVKVVTPRRFDLRRLPPAVGRHFPPGRLVYAETIEASAP